MPYRAGRHLRQLVLQRRAHNGILNQIFGAHEPADERLHILIIGKLQDRSMEPEAFARRVGQEYLPIQIMLRGQMRHKAAKFEFDPKYFGALAPGCHTRCCPRSDDHWMRMTVFSHKDHVPVHLSRPGRRAAVHRPAPGDRFYIRRVRKSFFKNKAHVFNSVRCVDPANIHHSWTFMTPGLTFLTSSLSRTLTPYQPAPGGVCQWHLDPRRATA